MVKYELKRAYSYYYKAELDVGLVKAILLEAETTLNKYPFGAEHAEYAATVASLVY